MSTCSECGHSLPPESNDCLRCQRHDEEVTARYDLWPLLAEALLILEDNCSCGSCGPCDLTRRIRAAGVQP